MSNLCAISFPKQSCLCLSRIGQGEKNCQSGQIEGDSRPIFSYGEVPFAVFSQISCGAGLFRHTLCYLLINERQQEAVRVEENEPFRNREARRTRRGQIMKRVTNNPAYRSALTKVHRKEQIITDLIEGRIGLREATMKFQQLESPEQPRAHTLSESICQKVIGWAQLALHERPERAEVVVARLEEEMTSCLVCQG